MTEFTSVAEDQTVKDCPLCGPYKTSKCRLAHTTCPYRDIDVNKGLFETPESD